MTLEQLYQWAKDRDLTGLPLYLWDDSLMQEVEVAGQSHDEAEDECLLSGCCGAPPVGETDLCSACREHADFSDGLPERIYLKG